MIILDTNIISELMKEMPNAHVVQWINKQNANYLYITTITIGEIVYGLEVLPLGKRRYLLNEVFHGVIMQTFKHRILPFTDSAAFVYGKIMGKRKSLGKPLSIPDGQIAAIGLSQGCSIATRNIKDFTDCELDLINPFD